MPRALQSKKLAAGLIEQGARISWFRSLKEGPQKSASSGLPGGSMYRLRMLGIIKKQTPRSREAIWIAGNQYGAFMKGMEEANEYWQRKIRGL